MKKKEELNALKKEVETLNKKLRELTEEELRQVTGGVDITGNVQLDPCRENISGSHFDGNSSMSGGAIFNEGSVQMQVNEAEKRIEYCNNKIPEAETHIAHIQRHQYKN